MQILRTPESRFANLFEYSYTPHYVELATHDGQSLRMRFLEEGSPDGPVVLLLHGEPSWSYLYRNMVAPLVAAGLRVVAPDLIGFGRSDKPAAIDDYSYQAHVDWMAAFCAALDLQQVNVFCQDWGGLIGLRLVAEQPLRFARLIAANTFLPTGDQPMPEAFVQWQQFARTTANFAVARIVSRGCNTPLRTEVLAAYDAPFPDESYKAGARAFPLLVPCTPDDPASAPNRRAWQSLLKFEKPFLTAFSDNDPITRGGDAIMHKLIPGCTGQPHTTLRGGGHFLQEDCAAELAQVIVKFVRR